VEQTEADLKELMPQSSWKAAHLQVRGTCASGPGTMYAESSCDHPTHSLAMNEQLMTSQYSLTSAVHAHSRQVCAPYLQCALSLQTQIIYFGREHCPAVGHDPAECPICSWAAVAPYNRWV
jgi:endonuclease III